MKKYFQSISTINIVQKFMILIFIIGFCLGIYEERYDIAVDHVVMLMLTVAIMYNTATIRNYKKLIDSYSGLTDAYEVRSNHQREIIAMLKHTIEVKNEDILDLQAKINETDSKTTRKSTKKPSGTKQ